MKRLSLPRKILLALAILLVLYLIPCVYVSARLYQMIQSSHDTAGKNNTYTDVISDQWYDALRCSTPDKSEDPAIDKVVRHCIFPVTFLYPGGGKSIYLHSHDAYAANGSLICGEELHGILVSYQFQNGALHVTDVFNPIVGLFNSIFVEHIYSN
mgnify:CR=1 FL=1